MFAKYIPTSFFSTLAKTLKSIDKSQLISLSNNLILVTENDKKIGQISKLDGHLKEKKNKYPHRAFSVFLFNSKNELLLQKRATKKITFPLLWTNTCCSHPLDTATENIEMNNVGCITAAQKRVKFEMGFNNQSKLNLYSKILYRADSDDTFEEFELDYVFLTKNKNKKIDDINYVNKVINRDEVACAKYVSYDKIIEDIEKNSNIYTPWFKLIMKKCGRDMFERVEKENFVKYKGEINKFI